MTARDPTELMCKEVVELVTEFLSDALGPEQRAQLEQHLLICPPCTIHVAQVKRTVELTAQLRDPPSPGLAPALADVFRRWKER